jgi:uncharacterized membrane protein
MLYIIATRLILLHGLNNYELYINPDEIVTIRSPTQQSLLKEGVKCAISTVDGKFVSVIEPCTEVNRLIGQVKKNGAEDKPLK